MTTPTLHTYYYPRPGGHNRVTKAPTEQRGPLTAAILRIAANLMADELAELKLATDAGIPNAQTTYNKAHEDPAGWLHQVANLQEVILTD